MPDKIVLVHKAPTLGAMKKKEDVHFDINEKSAQQTEESGPSASDYPTYVSTATSTSRSMNMIISHQELVKDQPANIDTIEDDEEISALPTNILVVAILHIVSICRLKLNK